LKFAPNRKRGPSCNDGQTVWLWVRAKNKSSFIWMVGQTHGIGNKKRACAPPSVGYSANGLWRGPYVARTPEDRTERLYTRTYCRSTYTMHMFVYMLYTNIRLSEKESPCIPQIISGRFLLIPVFGLFLLPTTPQQQQKYTQLQQHGTTSQRF
jgi:hypothetical protein